MVNQQLLLASMQHQILITQVLGLRTTCTITISVIGFLENILLLGNLCGLILLENVGDVYFSKNFRILLYYQMISVQNVVMFVKRKGKSLLI